MKHELKELAFMISAATSYLYDRLRASPDPRVQQVQTMLLKAWDLTKQIEEDNNADK